LRRVVILGSTGSIGRQALEVCRAHPGELEVVGLAAGENTAALAAQVEEWRPQAVAVGQPAAAGSLRDGLTGKGVKVLVGEEGLCQLAAWPDVDTVLVATAGLVGVAPTLEALQLGRRVALANKETLVAAGDLVMAQAARSGELLPVDSEHVALHQCLRGEEPEAVHRLVLTGSGGPFRQLSAEELGKVTPQQALRHPVWSMGAKITIDSATLMNKGLEVIEAHHLFGVDWDRIDVVIHPQGAIHSLVEMRDGALLAQLGVADMRLAIAYALFYPRRSLHCFGRLDLAEVGTLTFESPRSQTFPCLQYAYEAGRMGGTMPAVLAAADEVAVDRFLKGEIPFTGIPALVRQLMEEHIPDHRPGAVASLEEVRIVAAWARERARTVTVSE